MEEATQKSIILSEAGLVNNSDICIKYYGSTFACVCKKCNEERLAEIILLTLTPATTRL
jgi:hypothetical protein